MSRTIWDWLVEELGWHYGDIGGLGRFWRGNMVWVLLGLFLLVNLLILAGIWVRAFKRPIVDRDYRW